MRRYVRGDLQPDRMDGQRAVSEAYDYADSADPADTLKLEVDMGRVVGTRGETGIRAIVVNDGRVINSFPINVG